MPAKTVFVLAPPAPPANLPLDLIMEHYARIRDAIAGTQQIDTDDLPALLSNATFLYAFNIFKAISLLLPHLYFEAAAPIVRQLWEVSLNLHWVMADPDKRVPAFCGFTLIEYRKILQRQKGDNNLVNFDDATKTFQANYSFINGKGTQKQYSNYSNMSVQQRADQLGEPWGSEYSLIYSLTSMHTHGAPGAIVQSIVKSYYNNPVIREQDSSALMATIAMRIMIRNVKLLSDHGIIVNATEVMQENEAFIQMLKCHTKTK